jgi:hypothetical protein
VADWPRRPYSFGKWIPQEKRRDPGGLCRSQNWPRDARAEELQQGSLEPDRARALRGGDPPRRGPARRRRRAWWCAPASTPAARPTTSSSSRTRPRRHIDWGKTNKPISPERYRALYNRLIGYAQRRDLFARDCWAGADPAHRIGVRVVTETAWHNMFARNMFLRPKRRGARRLQPDFTILNLPGFQADPALDGTASDCAILVNFTDRVVAICGTWYAGEIKKSVFTILNYLLPEKNVLPMHASANIGPKGDVAIFFGSPAPARRRCRPILRAP